jgi:Fe-S oxidoreductase
VCPIYKLVGGHNYGHVYIGAIGLILTYFYHGRENARAIIKNCLNCQACKAVCPTGIDLPHLIKEVYRTILEVEGKKPIKNILLNLVIKDRRLFHFLLRRAYLVQKPLAGSGNLIRHLPLFFTKEHGFRSLPVMARTPLRDQWERIKPHLPNPRYRVALFGGCVVDFVYPEQAMAMVKLAKEFNVQLEFPMGQTCCGLPAKMMGENDTAREVALQNLKAVNPDDYDFILTLCASCGSHLKENYSRLLPEDSVLQVKVRQLKEKILDFSSFMQNVLQVPDEKFEGKYRKVAYHSPCHLCRGF